ncbi:integrin alpha-PS3-like [Condylostylus longicornis]|uniref:integrin alpha-PS3-like n=1 Tax=Condylostylus longicornis TaxID=2530218 RepID=UPI00244E3C9E|nr:integrin alpha-PS3-like [Condylostylus longicornis]
MRQTKNSQLYYDKFELNQMPNIYHSKPFSRETDPPLRDRPSYFGFSLLLRQNSILIGAPRASSTFPDQSAIIEPGALYKCSVSFNNSCEVIAIDPNDNVNNKPERNTEIKHQQWLGATISGDKTETEDKSTFIICAPSIRTRRFFLTFGICYVYKEGEPVLKYKPFINEIISNEFVRNLKAIANFGMSSYWIKERNLYLVGAPMKNLIGTYVRINVNRNIFQKSDNLDHSFDDTLVGYSVSAGVFDKENTVSYVISAPKYSGQGTVLVINEAMAGKKSIFLKGTQKYEYFGYSILTEDLNNDGISDIIVSAPFYSIKDRPETGAIYFFNGKTLTNNINKIITAPKREIRAKFGSSLASLGDINLDGYNDIAVGAPYIENGKVFIYHGSAEGINSRPTQIIEAPLFEATSRPNYFGYAISGGVDIDRNGVNDIAISSLNSDTVYLYRTYDITNVNLFFENFPQFIHFTKTSTTITACIKFSIVPKENFGGKKNLTFNLILKLDRIDNRIKFNDGSTQKIDTIVLTADQKECRNHSIHIEHAENRKSYSLQLTYEHIQDKLEENFCEECAVVHPDDHNKIVNRELFIRHSCGNNSVCNSNLKVEIFTEINRPLILNKDRYLNVSVKITNYIDAAYLPRVKISNKHNLSLTQIPPSCSERMSILQCNLWNEQLYIMKHKQLKIFNMIFDISNFEGSELTIEAHASSLSNEIDESDNNDNLRLTILRCNKVEIIEVSSIESQTLHLYDNQLKDFVLEKTFEVHNFGPSPLYNATFSIIYPAVYEMFLSPVQPLEENFYMNGINELEVFENSFDIMKNSSSTNIYEYQSNLRSSFSNLCQFTKFADLMNFQHQIVQNISKNETVFFDKDQDESSSINFHTEIYEIVMTRVVTTNSAWIYGVSFIVGILVYLIISLILYKVGFFKRKKHEEVKEFRRQSLRRQSSAARTSQQSPNSENNQIELSTKDDSEQNLDSQVNLEPLENNAL